MCASSYPLSWKFIFTRRDTGLWNLTIAILDPNLMQKCIYICNQFHIRFITWLPHKFTARILEGVIKCCLAAHIQLQVLARNVFCCWHKTTQCKTKRTTENDCCSYCAFRERHRGWACNNPTQTVLGTKKKRSSASFEREHVNISSTKLLRQLTGRRWERFTRYFGLIKFVLLAGILLIQMQRQTFLSIGVL